MTAPVPVLVVVQARTGSSRLPGKVLQELGGRPMLGLQLARLVGLADQPGLVGAEVIVATSDLPGDDAVVDVAAEAGVTVVRGSEADVLGRYALALDRHPAEVLVRLTGDCPLTDPAIVAAVVALHREAEADYTSNVLPRSFPKGLDVEVVGPEALRAAHASAVAGPDREHVTPYLYRHPSRFRLANLASGHDLGEEWWTVDTSDDLDRLRSMVALLDDPTTASWTEVLAAVGAAVVVGTGAVALRPEGTVAGAAPWVRRWTARVDDVAVGTVEVAADADAGAADRRYDVPAALRDAATAALDRLLAGDQQTRR